jgi:hypothetical protein
MADYARILATVDNVLDTNGLSRYRATLNHAAVDNLGADRFVSALAVHFTGNKLAGTAAELLTKVQPFDLFRAPEGWPTIARHVTQLLKRQAPTMRKAGWTSTDDAGKNRDKALRWAITPPPSAGTPTWASRPEGQQQLDVACARPGCGRTNAGAGVAAGSSPRAAGVAALDVYLLRECRGCRTHAISR